MAQQGSPHNPPLQVPANVYELIISHQLGRPLALYREKPRALPGACLLVVGVFFRALAAPSPPPSESVALGVLYPDFRCHPAHPRGSRGGSVFSPRGAVRLADRPGRIPSPRRPLPTPLSLRRRLGLPHRAPEHRVAVGPDHERDSLCGKPPFRSQFGVSSPTKRWSRTQH
jgi:hypothetical protein